LTRTCLTAAAICGLLGLWIAAPARSSAAARPREDVRGLWVVRTTLASPAGIERMIADAVSAGINTLLVQVRGRGEAYYRSDLEPRAAELDGQPTDFDPLALVIDRAHDAGLRVHAWVNVNLVASATTPPASPQHVARRHPEWLMVPRDLARTLVATDARAPAYRDAIARWTRGAAAQVEGLFLSPVASAAQDHTVAVLTELVERYPIDGLHLDYIRFPGPEFDYGRLALAEFRESQLAALAPHDVGRLDAAAGADPAAWAEALPDAWRDFRHARLTDLVARVAHNAKTARPGLALSAAVLPDSDEARDRKLQDWAAWARAGYFDAICPMIYTTDAAAFVRQLAAVHAAADSTPVWAGIGAYRLPIQRTIANVRAARREGAAGVLLFSYDSLVSPPAPPSSYLPSLRRALLETVTDGSSR
jgi:uncharacterized lipoprotein YddW (UPF0748 family)